MKPYLVFFAFILIISISYAAEEPIPEYFFNVTHISPKTSFVIPNTENVFSVDVKCFRPSSYLMAGDIVDMRIYTCFDNNCTLTDDFKTIYENGCSLNRQYSYVVPFGVSFVSIRLDLKRFDEPIISFAPYAQRSFDVIVPEPVNSTPVVNRPKLSQMNIFGITLPMIALAFFILGVVLLAFRSLFGILFLIIGFFCLIVILFL